MPASAFPWTAFTLFLMISSLTPGPNIILLTSSGGTWGLRRTMPHLLGVAVGFPVMLLLVQYGADGLFRAVPWSFTALTLLTLLYALWFAARVFKMGYAEPAEALARQRPIRFTEAALFQWINGKAWQMALMIATLYAARTAVDRVGSALVCALITFAAGLAWMELGRRIAAFLKHPPARKLYFSALAVALLLSTWPSGISRILAGWAAQ
jgi:threonine/homoserine/homoserine lactone efflux protein